METIKYQDKDGKNRIGCLQFCAVCKIEFIVRIDKVGKQKCCSKTCSAKSASINGSSTQICSWCHTEFRRKNSQLTIDKSKSGLYFCTRKCKDTAQRLGGITQIMPSHFGTGTTGLSLKDCSTRFDFDTTQCCDCGENRQYLLCIHHIDSNRTNNTESNLEVVCGNCHIKRHLDFVNGTWIHNFKKLTPREKLGEL